ncbi:MAG TPA: PIG-L family deacetylase [Blastocatellia bacterium]|nr:PIG-L family deacetylase [Blastocatellia bacterium]
MNSHRSRNRLLTLTLILAVIATGGLPAIRRVTGDAPPAEARGAIGLGQAIRRLGVVASVLHTGAHPDDEDSGLLAYLAQGRQARTAYLSLTRGDGGQNLLGPELYELLGVIRTDELLAARRLDGAIQFFTRAFDFGFSKSREETLAKWDREAVLGDMVRVIRTFRPLVIASQWNGTPTDGHGHHQAAGFLTPEAYRAAADPARFPEQIAEGLRPWKAKKLYTRASDRSQPRDGSQNTNSELTLSINTGQFDPLLGRSYYEVAMQGRSQHRTQDQGTVERRGPQFSRFKLIDSSLGAPRQEKDIFDGIDTSLAGIAEYAGGAAEKLKPQLAEVQAAANEAKEKYNPFSTSLLSPIISRGLKRLRAIRALLPTLGIKGDAAFDTEFLLKEKEKDFVDALARVEGTIVDCLTDDEVVVPGQTLNVSVFAYTNAVSSPVKVSLSVPPGWSVIEKKHVSSATDGRLVAQTDFQVTVASDAEFTQPYWLKNPRNKDMFVPGKGGTGIEPLSPPAVAAQVEFELAQEKVLVTQPAQYRFADKALGELRHDLKVAPAVSLNVSPALLIYPASGDSSEQEVDVSVTNNSKAAVRGTVKIEKQAASGVSAPQTGFELGREGERATLSFRLKRPTASSMSAAVAQVAGRDYNTGYQVVSYPHTEPRFVYRAPLVQTQVIEVRVVPGLKVGYIEGAGDDFANALKRLGVNVKVIDSRELAAGDLSVYDVIVTGIRIYEVRPDVIANNGRLLEYVNKGGTLIVQYNKNEIAEGNFTPYPVKMKRTPDRVTDENAVVTLLDPSHALFNFPNKITDRDFEGWVQERGTYFFSEWDPRFKPLIASHDPGEEDKKGGELIAEYGKGLYVYTGIAWFRQLPVGVPGAYRLIANLVSLPKAREK